LKKRKEVQIKSTTSQSGLLSSNGGAETQGDESDREAWRWRLGRGHEDVDSRRGRVRYHEGIKLRESTAGFGFERWASYGVSGPASRWFMREGRRKLSERVDVLRQGL